MDLQKQDEAEVYITDTSLGTITKDEEEVAEALFALAVVFPDAHTDNKMLVSKQSAASSSALTKAGNSTSRIKGLFPPFLVTLGFFFILC